MSETAWIIVGIAAFALMIGIVAAVRHQEHLKKRREDLTARFGAQIADLIMAKQITQGMTEEMIQESWGAPADIDQQVLKTKVKQTWKYNLVGKNRFANRVYIENGVVVGWKNN